jgi:membrane dipeptidase
MVRQEIPARLSVLARVPIVLLTASVLALAGMQSSRDWRAVHAEAVVVDGHNDILSAIMRGHGIEKRRSSGHSDLVRFREGGLDVQLCSVWVSPEHVQRGDAFAYANREIDSLAAIAKRNSTRMSIVRNRRELDAAVLGSKLACIVALEGGHPVGQSTADILALYRRGLRVFGLTWNNSTAWAGSAKDEAAGRRATGLTDYGKRVIRLLDSLGVIVDVSHLGPKSIDDVLRTTRNPVIASHSSCSAIFPHPRNLTDAQLRALAANGGVAMINYFPVYLKARLPKNVATLSAREEQRLAALRGTSTDEALAQRDRIIAAAAKRGLPTILDVADHIAHAVHTAGIDHVGLGSDFDGIDYAPVGLGDVTALPYLTRELLRRGYSEDDVRKVLGGNFLRVFAKVCM